MIIVLNFQGKLSEEFLKEPFVLHMPSLKQVKLKNYKGTESELFLVESLKTHNVVLGEIIAYHHGNYSQL